MPFRDEVWGFHIPQANMRTFRCTGIWLCFLSMAVLCQSRIMGQWQNLAQESPECDNTPSPHQPGSCRTMDRNMHEPTWTHVEWDKDSLNYWPFQGIKTKMHAQHWPDATIAMQPLFFPGFMLYWDVPNMSLPRGQTQVQSQGSCLCWVHTQGPCTRKSTVAISCLPPRKAQNTHQHTG